MEHFLKDGETDRVRVRVLLRHLRILLFNILKIDTVGVRNTFLLLFDHYKINVVVEIPKRSMRIHHLCIL